MRRHVLQPCMHLSSSHWHAPMHTHTIGAIELVHVVASAFPGSVDWAECAPGTATDIPDISADRVSSPLARRGPSAATPLVLLSDESPAHHHKRAMSAS